MPKSIDLGKKLDDMVKIHEISPDKAHYPELFISDTDDKRIAQMPDKGTATIKYRVVSRTHREESNGKGKEHSCSVRLEILSIDPPANGKRSGGYGDDLRKSFKDYFKE
jgi:hypothetical protein